MRHISTDHRQIPESAAEVRALRVYENVPLDLRKVHKLAVIFVLSAGLTLVGTSFHEPEAENKENDLNIDISANITDIQITELDD